MRETVQLLWDLFGVPALIVIIILLLTRWLSVWVDYQRLTGRR